MIQPCPSVQILPEDFNELMCLAIISLMVVQAHQPALCSQAMQGQLHGWLTLQGVVELVTEPHDDLNSSRGLKQVA